MSMFRNLATASVAIVALASVAQAQTVTQTGTVGSTTTTANLSTNSGTVTVNKFDSSLGTLNSVAFTLNGTLNSSATVTNAAGANGAADLNSLIINGRIKLTDSLGDNLVQVLPTSYVVGDVTAGTYPAGTTFILPSPQTIAVGTTVRYPATGTLTATASNSQSYNSGSILGLFTGSGTIDLFTAGTASNTTDISGGNTSSSQSSAYLAGITVVYNYTPTVTTATPEPGEVAFALTFGTGLVGLVVRARRRTAK